MLKLIMIEENVILVDKDDQNWIDAKIRGT
jgi:hypothetical protein